MKTIYIDGPLDAIHLDDVKEKLKEADAHLGDTGGKLIIKGLQPLIKNVFDMTGFGHIFNFE